LLVGESLLDGGVAVLAMLTLVRTRWLCRRSPLPGDDDPVCNRVCSESSRSIPPLGFCSRWSSSGAGMWGWSRTVVMQQLGCDRTRRRSVRFAVGPS
jgi:hypothetical protein